MRISLDAVERMLAERGIEGAAYGADDLLVISVLNLPVDKREELQKWFSATLTRRVLKPSKTLLLTSANERTKLPIESTSIHFRVRLR